jgi:hypothetical protein
VLCVERNNIWNGSISNIKRRDKKQRKPKKELKGAAKALTPLAAKPKKQRALITAVTNVMEPVDEDSVALDTSVFEILF